MEGIIFMNKIQVQTTIGDLIFTISEIVKEFNTRDEEEANFITHNVLMDLMNSKTLN